VLSIDQRYFIFISDNVKMCLDYRLIRAFCPVSDKRKYSQNGRWTPINHFGKRFGQLCGTKAELCHLTVLC